jgi:uncharacterized protein (TIGR00369 family)
MGLEVLTATADCVTARMRVEGNTQPLGLLHGGANVVLAESIASLAANIHAGPGRYAVGVDISATHLASATSGYVHAEAKALKLGGTIAVYNIEIKNDAGELTCVSRLTCAIRNRK